MSFDVTLSVAAGTGRLARNGRTCLYVPSAGIDDARAELIECFLDDQDDPLITLGDFVLSRHHEAPAFVLITWPAAAVGGGIRLIVRGDVVVTTDIASIPSLTGTGSSTWVEHRVMRNPAAALLHADVASSPGTDLAEGVVPAGGFSLALVDAAGSVRSLQPRPSVWAPKTTVIPDAEPVPETPAAPSPTPAPAPTPAPTAAPTAATSSPAPTAAPTVATDLPISGLAALRAATDESTPPPPADRPSPSVAVPPVPAPPPARTTSATHQPARPAPLPPTPIPPAPILADPTPPPTGRGVPPPFPGDAAVVRDSAPASDDPDEEVTLAPTDIGTLTEASTTDADMNTGAVPERLVYALLCVDGHPNPPHVAICVRCGLVVDRDTPPITVEQPVIAVAELPSGETIPLGGTVVVGRNPQLDAARCDDDARLVSIDAPASVSRTHLVIRVDGWSVTATDCGSQGGSALISRDEMEPTELTSWTPHELSGGDTIYLGGPTAIRIHDVAG